MLSIYANISSLYSLSEREHRSKHARKYVYSKIEKSSYYQELDL